DRIRVRGAREDEGQLTLLVLTVTAALASLAAIVAELGSSAGVTRRPAHVLLAALTILLSWAFIHTIFGLHYAHEFYDDEHGGGLAFPGGNPEPDYWDFVYFSFVIGMTSQVSDVAVTTNPIPPPLTPRRRRPLPAPGLVAFAFNASLLALSVNIAASVI